jgi:hypothetical protein
MKGNPMKHLIPLPVILLLLAGCDEDAPTHHGGRIELTASPLPYASIRRAMPLGNTNPPGHTFPTNHVGFYLEGTDPVEVYAPASGLIRTVYHNDWSGDNRIEIRHTSSFFTVLDHVADLPAGIEEGARVEAGQLLGYGNPNVSAVDLGVVDYDVRVGFITPARYHEFDLHCADPYLAFTPEIRAALLVTNPRTMEPRGGEICFDVDGTLSGNWFHESLPVNQSSGYTYAAGHLAFTRDDVDPSRIRITCGGTLASAPFDRAVEGNGPDPVTVRPEDGSVKYVLVSTVPTVLLVQMTGTRTLRTEAFLNKTPDQVTGFTPAAQNYIR